jgi:Asp-tRNA(Asn)/Glu-tRNA(Gln) amidotransferase A subunit family amidase
MRNLTSLSATQAVLKIAQGSLRPSTLLAAFLENIKQKEVGVNAFTQIKEAEALELAAQLDNLAANGLLFGIPFAVKDLIDTQGVVTTYGSGIYKTYIPQSDAACVAQTKRQGAIFLGKTVTTEFAGFEPGKTKNPHNLEHTPGGSSSGSAAAVSARMVPLAFGTQTVASIYRPASFCGVVGYKPTYGTIARSGTKPLADSLDTVGVFANSVQDASLFAAASANRRDFLVQGTLERQAPRIGICRTYEWHGAETETVLAIESCANLLSSRGAIVADCALPENFKSLLQAQVDIMAREAAMALSYEYIQRKDCVSQKLIDVIDQGLSITDSRLLEAYSIVVDCKAQLGDLFRKFDLLLAPAARGEAPEGLQSTGDPLFGRIWSALGNPGIVIPWSRGPKGLPVGVLFSAMHFNDNRLLYLTDWIERQRGDF